MTRVFQFSEEALDWEYEHDGTSAKPARRPGFGAGPPGIAGTASSSTSHPDAGRLRHALRGPQPLRDSSMGPPARCRHGAGHGFHPAQDASGGQPSYRIPSAGTRPPSSWTRPPETALAGWSRAGLPEGSAIAVDGKALRGIHGQELPGVRLVAGYAHESSLLDFVHLGGVGEDVGELSVNCGWGFSAVGFQPSALYKS